MKKILRTEPEGSEIYSKTKRVLQKFQEGDQVCEMKKALYGLRQAGRSWYETLCTELCRFGLTQSKNDPCVFYLGRGEEIFIVTIYVDDILVVSRDMEMIERFKKQLSEVFDFKNLGNAKYCLGIEFDRKKGEITMNQRGYLNDILEKFGMKDSKSVATPIELGTRIIKCEDSRELEKWKNLPYRELVGSLMYLSVCTRPDISHAVSYLSQYNSCYDQTHWIAAERVLRYLNGTKNVGLKYRKTLSPLLGYVDADWANCVDDRKSYTGFAFILGGCVISWESRKQRTVALSSTGAEYMALNEATKEAVHLQRFLVEMGFTNLAKGILMCDNNGALKLAKNPVFHNRTKHIDVKHHAVRDIINSNSGPKLEYISTNDMGADILTKGLAKPKHNKCLEILGILPPKEIK
uniref:Reverse transcriptase Ty1/copia-type domain-containing protein n=1 Tax=Bracon brevicornis TaxID=1563983 RepID=A0A6V7J2D0_9HYME